MKCPKCGYLGFEQVDRCRNCGYEFSLIWPPAEQLPIRSQPGAAGTLEDLPLASSASPAPAAERKADARVDTLEWPATDAGIPDLPLFDSALLDDEPLIAKASQPRPPLAVRRATPEVPRLRDDSSGAPLFDFDSDATRRRMAAGEPVAKTHLAGSAAAAVDQDAIVPAGWIARSTALLIDLAILSAIDLLVVYFTMQICGLTLADWNVLPKGPLTAFLIVQNGGYLVTFTLGGQTLGKMAMGIRVVPTRAEAPLDLGRSVVRTIIWIALAVPAGLGFLTALFSHDRRGLHDRCAGTRVVRAA